MISILVGLLSDLLLFHVRAHAPDPLDQLHVLLADSAFLLPALTLRSPRGSLPRRLILLSIPWLSSPSANTRCRNDPVRCVTRQDRRLQLHAPWPQQFDLYAIPCGSAQVVRFSLVLARDQPQHVLAACSARLYCLRARAFQSHGSGPHRLRYPGGKSAPTCGSTRHLQG